jgi:hypothetical protein
MTAWHLPAEPARPELHTHTPVDVASVPTSIRLCFESLSPSELRRTCSTRSTVITMPHSHQTSHPFLAAYTQRMSCHQCTRPGINPCPLHAVLPVLPFAHAPHHTDKCPHRPLVRREGSANATSASPAPRLLIALATWLIDAVAGELYLFRVWHVSK